ncbi:hypothetical protein J6590_055556 [Homalodisca vitripennis]|nr:hypothetical protein J6590_055556 [Homalodisca vitripennis]
MSDLSANPSPKSYSYVWLVEEPGIMITKVANVADETLLFSSPSRKRMVTIVQTYITVVCGNIGSGRTGTNVTTNKANCGGLPGPTINLGNGSPFGLNPHWAQPTDVSLKPGQPYGCPGAAHHNRKCRDSELLVIDGVATSLHCHVAGPLYIKVPHIAGSASVQFVAVKSRGNCLFGRPGPQTLPAGSIANKSFLN